MKDVRGSRGNRRGLESEKRGYDREVCTFSFFFVVNYDVLWVGFEDRQRRVSGVIFLGIQVKLVKETVISMGEFWSGKQV